MVRSQPAPAARIHAVRLYVVVKRLGARGTYSGDLMTHPDAWPHMCYLKRQRPANLHTIAHRPPTWHHIRHGCKCERSAGELVFGDEARGLHPRSSRLSRCNSSVVRRGRDRTSGGHAGARRREHRQPRILLATVQRPAPPRSGTPPRMSRAWEAAGHGVPTGQSISRVLLFLVGDRTFTSRVLNPAPVHRDRRWRTSVAVVE